MVGESVFGRIQKALSPDKGSNDGDNEDAKVEARRRFLKLAGAAIVAPGAAGEAAVAGAGSILSETIAAGGTKAILDKIGEDAQKDRLKRIGGSVANTVQELLKTWQAPPGREDMQEIFDVVQVGRDLLAQKGAIARSVSPKVIETLDIRRQMANTGLQGLPEEMKIGDLVSRDIELAFENITNADGTPSLPGKDIRTALTDKIKQITDLGDDATFADVRQAYVKRTDDVIREVFANIDNPTVCNPAEREKMLEALNKVTPPTPENMELRSQINNKWKEVEASNEKKREEKDQKEREERNSQLRENVGPRVNVRARISDLPDEPGMFELRFELDDERELKAIRKLEKTDIYQLIQKEWPEVEPRMMNVTILKDGATIESKDAKLTELLYEMTRREESLVLPDRRYQDPLRKVE